MEKKLHLTAITTQEELELYQQSKNVDPATILPPQYHNYLDIFSKKEADTLPLHQVYDHAIHFKEGAQLPVFTLYGISCDEALKLHQYLDENLSKRFIWASHSQAATPVLFIKKSEEGLHFCIDYKSLNAITVKNHYPLSLISEILNHLNHAKIFTKLNIISAFNRLWIKKKDETLTAFCTHFNLFEYLIIPFDLYNEPASFQEYINDTLWEYLNKFCTAYLNNILIYSNNEAEHKIHIKHIFQKLKKAGLQADIIKCAFHVTQILYLGLIIITEGVKMDPAKVSTIINWPTLINVKDVQSFLEFINFYRRFIYSYSKIATLLTYFIKKDVTFAWFSECQMIFNILKETFISDVILHHYNSNHKIVIEINVSDYVSEGILSQYNENEILHSVAYFLKKHNSTECNYKIYDKKFIIIVCVFEEWHLKLEGFISPVKVITDYKNIEYFMFIKQLSCHQACWSEFLFHFNYCITYHPDKAESKSNALIYWSDNLPREGDTSDSHHLYQH